MFLQHMFANAAYQESSSAVTASQPRLCECNAKSKNGPNGTRVLQKPLEFPQETGVLQQNREFHANDARNACGSSPFLKGCPGNRHLSLSAERSGIRNSPLPRILIQ